MTNSKDIDQKIFEFIVYEDWPVPTDMAGIEMKVSWNMAQLHLYKLLVDGLIKGKRVDRQNQWMATDKGRKAVKK